MIDLHWQPLVGQEAIVRFALNGIMCAYMKGAREVCVGFLKDVYQVNDNNACERNERIIRGIRWDLQFLSGPRKQTLLRLRMTTPFPWYIVYPVQGLPKLPQLPTNMTSLTQVLVLITLTFDTEICACLE